MTAEAPWRHLAQESSQEFLIRPVRACGWPEGSAVSATPKTIYESCWDRTFRTRSANELRLSYGRCLPDKRAVIPIATLICALRSSGGPESSNPKIWGGAWYELGYFLIVIGDVRAAEIPMRRAIECGHPDVVDQALQNLGMALARQEGRERDAELLLREATKEQPDDVFAAMALCELPMLLASQLGRESDAEASLRAAIDAATREPARDQPVYRDFLPQALCNLGILVASQDGRQREAEAVLRRGDRAWPSTMRFKRTTAPELATARDPDAACRRNASGRARGRRVNLNPSARGRHQDR